MMAAAPAVQSIAAEIAKAIWNRRQIEPVTARDPDFDIEQAYAVADELRHLRVHHGETPLGRKIGFTNRSIWAEYGVSAPMWGDVYDSTTCDVDRKAICNLSRVSEPQIEPEIVFGFSRTPSADMDERAMLGCIDWVAHGFEIVQSIFPKWKFNLADTIAANGLHGALMIGPRHRIADCSADEWMTTLKGFEIRLYKDGTFIDRGTAMSVLDGPLSALVHLVRLLDRDPHNPQLRAGEVVTTGTVTRAFPVAAGQTWTTEISGIALDPLSVTFT
jgi:2-oxo-3-hexenedioate decarboxylase